MNLEKKKALAARTLGVGKDRIHFNVSNLAEIKESLTKQDIRDLVSTKAIIIKEAKGRKRIVTRKLRRRQGSIRKKLAGSKKEYVTLARKLRAYVFHLKARGLIKNKEFLRIRTEIKAGNFKNLSHLKEGLAQNA